MSLVLTLDPDDPTPPYEQLRRQLSDLITAGQLGPGDRLPPLRQLAGDLGLAVGTVGRTYRELEQEGRLISSRGGGTRVAATEPAATIGRLDLLASMTQDFLTRARALGFNEKEITVAFKEGLPRNQTLGHHFSHVATPRPARTRRGI